MANQWIAEDSVYYMDEIHIGQRLMITEWCACVVRPAASCILPPPPPSHHRHLHLQPQINMTWHLGR